MRRGVRTARVKSGGGAHCESVLRVPGLQAVLRDLRGTCGVEAVV